MKVNCFYIAMFFIAVVFSGCRQQAATLPPDPSSNAVQVADASTMAALKAESAPVAQAPAASTGSGLDLSDLSIYSNTSIPFGTKEDDRDANNVPNGIYYYQSLYGQYRADFIQDTTKPVIYLTMDEGYEAGYTPLILDTLREKGVHAVFFITKQFFDSSPELVQRMIDEGHILGNHTCAHPAGGMPQLGVDAEREDVMTLHNLVKEKFGYEMKLFRFPEGVFSEQSLALMETLGYKSVFWSFAHKDYSLDAQPDPAESLAHCVKDVHNGAIYLLHAVSETNTTILGDWIDQVRALGFEFGVYPLD